LKLRIFLRSPNILRKLSKEYIQVVNQLTEQAEQKGFFPKVTTKQVESSLPSAVLNQAIRDARSVYRKAKQQGKRPILKQPVYFLNNQNYSIGEDMISFPIRVNGRWEMGDKINTYVANINNEEES
jgi:putative transposase